MKAVLNDVMIIDLPEGSPVSGHIEIGVWDRGPISFRLKSNKPLMASLISVEGSEAILDLEENWT